MPPLVPPMDFAVVEHGEADIIIARCVWRSDAQTLANALNESWQGSLTYTVEES